jgi:hypothetical protein
MSICLIIYILRTLIKEYTIGVAHLRYQVLQILVIKILLFV